MTKPGRLETDVLIVGAGPVGLALALELGRCGVACLVVEARERTSMHPRAKLTNIRSMALMRRWGIADQLRAASPLPSSFPADIAFVTRLTGWELYRFPNALSTVQTRDPLYPEPAQQVPQWVVEATLRESAECQSSVGVHFGWRLDSFVQNESGITAAITEVATGRPVEVRSSWMAGCDGVRSTVRRGLGIEMEGSSVLGRNFNFTFRAPDLWTRHDKARAVHYWLINQDISGIMGPLNPTDLWWFMATDLPEDVDLSAIEPVELLYQSVGAAFPCEILVQDPWIAHRQLATHYRSGRVFILGDAAHLHPPHGGYGMNMGIGDAVDVGWKLAAVLHGWGSPDLLDSYQIERRRLHQSVIEEASSNYILNSGQLAQPGLEDNTPHSAGVRAAVGERIREVKSKEFASIGVQLGYRYEDSPVIVPDGTPATPFEVSRYRPTARPGHLAPHAWLNDGSSLYDHFGPGFTLLVLGADEAEASRIRAAAHQRRLPLSTLRSGDPQIKFLYDANLVLVRPDQHVAWRTSDPVPDPLRVIDRIRGSAVAALW